MICPVKIFLYIQKGNIYQVFPVSRPVKKCKISFIILDVFMNLILYPLRHFHEK